MKDAGAQLEGAGGIKFLTLFPVSHQDSSLAETNWNSEGKGAHCTPNRSASLSRERGVGRGVGLEGNGSSLAQP